MKMTDSVCIGMVNDGTINGLLAMDFIHITRLKDSKFKHMVQVGNVGLTTRSRNLVVKTFLETTDCEWLLMIDSDERLSVETWLKLCDTAHDKDRPIVSGLVFAAFFNDDGSLRPVPTMYYQTEEAGLTAIDGYPENSVIEVDAVGTGCILIHRKVLLDMQSKATENQGKDWAWFVEGAIGGVYYGEDILFSKRLRAMGWKIHVDTGAILPHNKDFWLDQRHHHAFRAEAIKAQSALSEPLTDSAPTISEE